MPGKPCQGCPRVAARIRFILSLLTSLLRFLLQQCVLFACQHPLFQFLTTYALRISEADFFSSLRAHLHCLPFTPFECASLDHTVHLVRLFSFPFLGPVREVLTRCLSAASVAVAVDSEPTNSSSNNRLLASEALAQRTTMQLPVGHFDARRAIPITGPKSPTVRHGNVKSLAEMQANA